MNENRNGKKWLAKMVSRILLISVASFTINSCVISQNMPEAFEGERVPHHNPITSPLTDKAEQLGDWIREKTS